MRDIRIVKATHDVNDCIDFPYVRKKFVAEALAFARAFDKTCDIHKFKRGRRDFFAVVKSGEFLKSLVGDGNHTHVGFNRAERIICRLRACLGYCVEKRALAYVWQTYDTEFHISPHARSYVRYNLIQ